MTITNAVRESTTLKLVIPCWLAVLVKYLGAGLDFGFGSVPAMSATEFATSIAAILSVWLARETKESYFKHKNNQLNED